MSKKKIVAVLFAALIAGCGGGGGSSSSQGSEPGASNTGEDEGSDSSGENQDDGLSVYSTGYIMLNAKPGWFDGSYYLAQLDGASTNVFKAVESGADLIVSKDKGSSNASGDGAVAYFDGGVGDLPCL